MSIVGMWGTPPDALMLRVAGHADPDVFRRAGLRTFEDFERALQLTGGSFTGAERIYEFGCGCGRLTRWIVERAPDSEVVASDIDAEAIAWLERQSPGPERVFVNDPVPPLDIADSSVDVVVAWSVFTHFPEDLQDAWLAELRRVMRPKALAAVSVHGRQHWNFSRTQVGETERATLESELQTRGFAYKRVEHWTDLPDYYQMSWHFPHYVRDHWSQWFDVAAVLEGEGMVGPKAHDIVLLSPRR
jgi:SAM-dependent methyltransferase